MTLKQKVGGLLVVGFDGTEMDESFKSFVSEGAFSGFILFKRNIESVEGLRKLTRALRSLYPKNLPPILAVDEEGGRVTQIGHLMPAAPPASAIGKTRSSRFAFFQARDVGQKLKWLGFNVVFAPVLDVNDEPANPVIGDRSFGKRPGLVSALGCATASGFAEAGLVATGKHFPGHGSATVDSHEALPVIVHPAERWYKFEFIPFQEAAQSGLRMMMTAHVACPGLTGRDDLPATFSSRVIDEILRRELGFSGVVVTDALEMAAAEAYMKTGTGPEMAFLAGCDLLLFAYGGRPALMARDALVRAVEEGRIPEERLDASVARITMLRESLA
ncbi:MAG: glycoside hydrolase family 3 protein [Candidatus Eisenbacteria bacterium]|nr:glycoside hydrolase family 3 protein [Candidatus Eisenbacteria bacterium]